MQYHFEVRGIQETKDRVDAFWADFRRRVSEALEWFGAMVSQEAKADHPYQDRTYSLTNSIGFSMAGNGMTVLVFATMWYAELVEDGTPHSRPYPFFWPKFYKYLPELMARLQQAAYDAERAFAVAS